MNRDVYDQLIMEKRVLVDGRGFFRCKFVRSTLVFSGKSLPHFSKCEFEGIHFQLVGAAEITRKLLKIFYEHNLGVLADAIVERPPQVMGDSEDRGH